MPAKFYVSHDSQQLGPYTVTEIIDRVGDGTLSPLDYIYDEKKSDWVLFLDHPELREKVKATKPKAPPRVQEDEPAPEKARVKKPSYNVGGTEHEWYVLKGENKFGPFS